MIELEGIGRIFESEDGTLVEACQDVSLSVAEREFISVVGPSGCGKSTLIRLIAGLAAPTSGEVRVRGQRVVGPREDVAIVFQRPTLLPWSSVLENVLLPLALHGRVDAAARKRARDLLAMVGLVEFERSMPHELSGGMQQRAAICRALLQDPEVLLMDEPFGALDALTREEMALDLLRIWSERPKTIVFVTHSISEAVLLSDRVAVMSARPGRISELVGIPLARPRQFSMEGNHEFHTCAQRIREHIFNRPGRLAT